MNQKQFRQLVSEMPPLKHSLSKGELFDIQDSQVVKWLISQPGIMQFIFSKAASTKCIEYDKATGMWSGRWCDAEFNEAGGRIPIDRELFLAALIEIGATFEKPATIASVQRHMEAHGNKVSNETVRAALLGLVKNQRINFRCDDRPYYFWPKKATNEEWD